jgi:SAM-dependent methyltransferase
VARLTALWDRLVAKLACPACGGRGFRVALTGDAPAEIADGTLTCHGCGRVAPIIRGMADFRGQLSPTLEQEKRQWEVFAASEGWLDPSDDYLLTLPYPAVPVPTDTLTWPLHAWNFERMLERVEVRGRRVLDVAAGRCWSTRLLAERGAECTATDIMEHPTLGLGVGERLFRRYDIAFERVLCDMIRMPFAPDAFDVVWISGSLHHTLDLEATIREIARVLRPGGQLVLVNEACGGLRGDEVLHLSGTQEGINEHEYRTWRYLLYLRRHGFRHIQLMRDYGFFHKAPASRLERMLQPLARRSLSAYALKLILLGKELCLSATKC